MAEKIVDFRLRDGSKPDVAPNPFFTVQIDPQYPYDEAKVKINNVPLEEFKDPINLQAFPAVDYRQFDEVIEIALLETREAFFYQRTPDKRELDLKTLAHYTQIIALVGGHQRLQRKIWDMCSRHFGDQVADEMLAPYAPYITTRPAQPNHLRRLK